jgi:hypothetical protein
LRHRRLALKREERMASALRVLGVHRASTHLELALLLQARLALGHGCERALQVLAL